MGQNWPSEGFGNSSAYILPGLPFVLTTASATTIVFPKVTKQIVITASAGDCSVFFSAGAGATRKFLIKSNTTVTLDLRVSQIWVEPTGTVSVCASLTMINADQMPKLDPAIWPGI